MIYDLLDNIEQYTGLFPNLDTAINFVAETDLASLPLGKTEIDGDDVFVLVSDVTPRTSEDNALFETHSKYMDIHIDIDGAEIIETSLGDLSEVEEYNEETDIAFYETELSSACIMGEERFLISMVEEPHRPAMKLTGFDVIRKCVIKVSVE